MRATVRTSVKLNLDISARARQATEQAARVVFPELNSAFQDAIGSKVWAWPRQTMRSNGQQVGTPRNIVDTKDLKQFNSFTVSGTLATFKWSVGYATAVHYGASIYPWGDRDKPKVDLPPRPWTSAVLGTVKIGGIEPFDYQSQFRAAFIQAFKASS